MTDPSTFICVVCDNERRREQAIQFANRHSLPFYEHKSEQHELQLFFGIERVELYDRLLNASIHVDFASGSSAHRQQFGGGRGQAIAKAVGLKHGNTPSVLDITAGLARDAYVLATLGCKLTLVEQSPVLVTLIEDAITRGVLSAQSRPQLENNFNIYNMDALEYMNSISSQNRPDVIYIDPMYPERKKSAQVKKDMQILQHLVGKDTNEENLLEAALNAAGKRVVVKRPAHAAPVGKREPHTSIRSKKTRYDIYMSN